MNVPVWGFCLSRQRECWVQPGTWRPGCSRLSPASRTAKRRTDISLLVHGLILKLQINLHLRLQWLKPIMSDFLHSKCSRVSSAYLFLCLFMFLILPTKGLQAKKWYIPLRLWRTARVLINIHAALHFGTVYFQPHFRVFKWAALVMSDYEKTTIIKTGCRSKS